VRDVLHRSPAVLGLFQTVYGVGLVGTALCLPRLGRRVTTPAALSISVLLSGVAAAAYVGTRWILVAYIGVFLWGVDVAFFSAPMQTLLQRGSPIEAHGRVLALGNTFRGWGNVTAIPLTGLVVGALGVHATGTLVGGLAVAAGTAGLIRARRWPDFASTPQQLITAT
jgi:predicted MFS family arabinose efflux permease